MKVLILGGTGTLGSTLTKKLYNQFNTDITIFSRDELKQSLMAREYPNARYVLGDIRSLEDVTKACLAQDLVFHVAALKRIDILEKNVEQCIKTNIIGSSNVANAVLEQGVQWLVFSSTDKACLPINAYGDSKYVSERLFLALNESQDITKFAVYRWGNVLGSRGSALLDFVKSLKKGEVNITDKRMSRFWIPIESAVDFMLDTYTHAHSDDVMIPKMGAAPVERIVDVLARLLSVESYKINYVGIRPGEKIHESIYTSHETCLRSDNAYQLTDEEIVEMLMPIVRKIT